MIREWRKSSYSESGNCIEIAQDWRISTHSGANGQCVDIAAGYRKSTHSGISECVEVGKHSLVLIRDTKMNGEGPVLKFTGKAWAEFTARVRKDMAA